ncbi:hypothetical protein [Paenibacillus sp. J2TS4]|uniref:hypothetical protein n=1 Tax=Paenibacillus sp. J2TS4 TaxID=2807194 RepID=UPI001AFF9438|nr:hypothetical protein [Paenibacillus sp. J2TS4]GIP36213.1 hypothetical protein J2TS4_54230 [Paenibacillus sp. J2TS4]
MSQNEEKTKNQIELDVYHIITQLNIDPAKFAAWISENVGNSGSEAANNDGLNFGQGR